MADLIFVSSNNELVRRLVLWQVYRQLAARAKQPHTMWLNRIRQQCNSAHPLVGTKKLPSTFKALLDVDGHLVGIINVSISASTIFRAIQELEGAGAEIIVCGIRETERMLLTQNLPNQSIPIELPSHTIQIGEYQQLAESAIFMECVDRIIKEVDKRIHRN